MKMSFYSNVKFFFILLILFIVRDSQAQWQPDVRFTNNGSSSFTPLNYKAVAANGNVVHVVWYDDRDGNFELYYKRSQDGGISWGSDTRLTSNSGTSWFSSIAVSGTEVHIAWMDDRDGNFEIYYKRSTDGGLSWSADTRLTFNTAASQFSSISASGSVVNVIWQDSRDGNTEIYYKRSSDAGISWGSDTRLTNNPAASMFSSVSASGSIVNILWEEYRDGNAEIYDKHSTDGGLSWSADMRLTNNTAESFSPSVWVYGLAVHVVWYDVRDGNAEVYYKRSTDAGLSWGTDKRLTNNSAGSYHPSVTASGSNVHLVWYDERDGNREVYYKFSTDAGLSWGTDTRLTNNSSESSHPSIAVSNQSVQIIWQDIRNGNWELYSKRNPTGNPQIININISMIAEGFYNATSGRMNRKDTVRAYLRNNITPYSVVDSAKSVIDSLTFTGNFSFDNVPSGTYYIVLKHRNSMETWSRNGGETLTSGSIASYDFTSAGTQAFGSNMTEVDTLLFKFAIYGGDADQDGLINLPDIIEVSNDAVNFITGYVQSDMNGDNFVNLADLLITYNNSERFVNVSRP